MKKPHSIKQLVKHPREVLLNDFMHPLGFTANRLALALHIPRQRIGEILNGRRGITTETAMRLSKLFNTTPKFWLDLQVNYELSQAENKYAYTIDQEIEPINLKKLTSISQFISIKQEVRQKRRHSTTSVKLTGTQKKIYKILSSDPIHFDDLCRKSGISAGDLSATLTFLELDNLVKRHLGDFYSVSS